MQEQIRTLTEIEWIFGHNISVKLFSWFMKNIGGSLNGEFNIECGIGSW